MPCYHHSFDLLDSFKRNADRDQHGRSADIQVVDLEYEGQNQRDRCTDRKTDRSDEGDIAADLLDILKRRFARTDTRDKAAVLLQVVRDIHRIEGDGSVEICKENDQNNVQACSEPVACGKPVKDRSPCAGRIGIKEACNDLREAQQRDREDDRDNSDEVHADRNMCALTAVLLASLHSLGVLDRNPSLTERKQNDKRYDQNKDYQQDNKSPLVLIICQRADHRRNAGQDVDHNDQGHTVADALSGDALTDPHDKRSTGREDNHGNNDRPYSVNAAGHHIVSGIQAVGDSECLDQRQRDCQITGILVDLLPSGFTFLIQLFQTRNRDGQKAHDNRCVDVRRDAHGEKIHAAECSAAHRVKQRKYTVIRGEILTDDSRIDERTRQCGAKSDEREHQEREDQSLP